MQRLNGELDTSQTSCRKLEAELKEAQDKSRDLSEALEKCQREKAALGKEMQSMKTEWDATRGDLEKCQREKAALDKENKSMKTEWDATRGALEKCQREKAALDKEKESMQKELDAALSDLTVRTREVSDANLEIAELKHKSERDAEAMARLESEVEKVGASLDQEKFARKKVARELSDEKGRATTLEMSWNKTVVQRDGLQEQLEKMQVCLAGCARARGGEGLIELVGGVEGG